MVSTRTKNGRGHAYRIRGYGGSEAASREVTFVALAATTLAETHGTRSPGDGCRGLAGRCSERSGVRMRSRRTTPNSAHRSSARDVPLGHRDDRSRLPSDGPRSRCRRCVSGSERSSRSETPRSHGPVRRAKCSRPFAKRSWTSRQPAVQSVGAARQWHWRSRRLATPLRVCTSRARPADPAL